jgi:hypothetical protein
MNRERLKQGIQETLSLTYRVNGSINLELDVSNGGTLRSCLLHRFIVTFLFVKVATWPNDDVHVSVKTLRIKTKLQTTGVSLERTRLYRTLFKC